MVRRVLIANRGEIAVRIIRTLREMGITSVATYSDADRDALFVLEADEAYRLGPSPAEESYLNMEAVLSVARSARVDAIHPGYGFLAENPRIAEAVAELGLTFIGPPAAAIRLMGDKLVARRTVARLGVPVVPGTPGPVTSLEQALDFGRAAGYPVAVKAAGGGGGRGIRVVEDPDDLADALERAAREAQTYFGNPEVYIERFFRRARHVEVQVLGDCHGRLVHLGERDCSVQRRHQKLIEETPSPAVDRALRARMGEMALRAAKSVEYGSAGTVEFLLSDEGDFYFLEMNTRIQVEHPITELVTGVDLIREMVLAASGEPLSVQDSRLDLDGHAMEVRVNAEDPSNDFRPTPAPIVRYREPGGIGVRVDSGVYQGYAVPKFYDSLMSKLVAWAPDRAAARARTGRALREYIIEGPSSTVPFAQAVLLHPVYVAGEATTSFVADHWGDLRASLQDELRPTSGEPAAARKGQERAFEVEVNRKLFHVRLTELLAESSAPDRRRVTRTSASARRTGNVLVSPMHGTVVAIKKQAGEPVAEGETVLIIEAMKMENEVGAHRSGTLTSLGVEVGETVDANQQLAVIE